MKNQRNINLAKIHLAKKQLGLDDDTYRSIILQTTGKDSAAKCTDRQLEKVVKTFEEKGWKQNKNIKRFQPVALIYKKSTHYGGSFRIWASLNRQIWLNWTNGSVG